MPPPFAPLYAASSRCRYFDPRRRPRSTRSPGAKTAAARPARADQSAAGRVPDSEVAGGVAGWEEAGAEDAPSPAAG